MLPSTLNSINCKKLGSHLKRSKTFQNLYVVAVAQEKHQKKNSLVVIQTAKTVSRKLKSCYDILHNTVGNTVDINIELFKASAITQKYKTFYNC